MILLHKLCYVKQFIKKYVKLNNGFMLRVCIYFVGLLSSLYIYRILGCVYSTYIISTWNLNENKKVVIYFVKQLGYSIAHKKYIPN